MICQVVIVPREVREHLRAWDSTAGWGVWLRRPPQQLQKRDHRADQHSAQKARTKHSHQSCNSDHKLGAVCPPLLPQLGEFEQAGHRHKHLWLPVRAAAGCAASPRERGNVTTAILARAKPGTPKLNGFVRNTTPAASMSPFGRRRFRPTCREIRICGSKVAS
jgi:hypothetical protein